MTSSRSRRSARDDGDFDDATVASSATAGTTATARSSTVMFIGDIREEDYPEVIGRPATVGEAGETAAAEGAPAKGAPSEGEGATDAAPSTIEQPDVGGAAARDEVAALVAEVLPGEVARVDDLLAQFQGREDKLMATLQGMKARAVAGDEREEDEPRPKNDDVSCHQEGHVGTGEVTGDGTTAAPEPDARRGLGRRKTPEVQRDADEPRPDEASHHKEGHVSEEGVDGEENARRGDSIANRAVGTTTDAATGSFGKIDDPRQDKSMGGTVEVPDDGGGAQAPFHGRGTGMDVNPGSTAVATGSSTTIEGSVCTDTRPTQVQTIGGTVEVPDDDEAAPVPFHFRGTGNEGKSPQRAQEGRPEIIQEEGPPRHHSEVEAELDDKGKPAPERGVEIIDDDEPPPSFHPPDQPGDAAVAKDKDPMENAYVFLRYLLWVLTGIPPPKDEAKPDSSTGEDLRPTAIPPRHPTQPSVEPSLPGDDAAAAGTTPTEHHVLEATLVDEETHGFHVTYSYPQVDGYAFPVNEQSDADTESGGLEDIESKADTDSSEGGDESSPLPCWKRYERSACFGRIFVIFLVVIAIAVSLSVKRNNALGTAAELDSTRAPTPPDPPNMIACVCSPTSEGNQECNVDNNLSYQQAQIASSFSMCVHPSNDASIESFELGGEVYLRHLESDISRTVNLTSMEARDSYLTSEGGLVDSIVKTTVLTPSLPLTDIFSTISDPSSFVGTLEVTGEVSTQQQEESGANNNSTELQTRQLTETERETFQLLINLTQPTSSPSGPELAPCINTAGYVDMYGDRCDYYEADANYPLFCANYGASGESGKTPNENCCVCKEALEAEKATTKPNGPPPVPPPTIPPSQKPTSSDTEAPAPAPCTDTAGYVDMYGDGCDFYAADPNYPLFCANYGASGESGKTPNENCCVCKEALEAKEATIKPNGPPPVPPTMPPSQKPTTVEPTEGPSSKPTTRPTPMPSIESSDPSKEPTSKPTDLPSARPSNRPSNLPTKAPSSKPTLPASPSPTRRPSDEPTKEPTSKPTGFPSARPTREPSDGPTKGPSSKPTLPASPSPTRRPSDEPTKEPTSKPTGFPSARPTREPSDGPTKGPSSKPTAPPTSIPTKEPSEQPTNEPTSKPTGFPSARPTREPSDGPTKGPSSKPTAPPTSIPTKEPSEQPTNEPTSKPTGFPSARPTREPSDEPTKLPTKNPTRLPSTSPERSPSKKPTTSPTQSPTPAPSQKPTVSPTASPTKKPTVNPTQSPSPAPTQKPSVSPTASPTKEPAVNPTQSPSPAPTQKPSVSPTLSPTTKPTASPTAKPTPKPTLKAFADKAELQTAVDDCASPLTQTGAACESAKSAYGWPMGTWQVGAVTDMS
ncbi:hypothetical protein ACHAXT_012038, partial [Thalassiosira profunda]